MKEELKVIREQLYGAFWKQNEFVMQHKEENHQIAKEIDTLKQAYAKSMINQIRGVKDNDKY